MLYQDHWDDVKTRMTGYWEREAMDRCCTAICVKNPDFDPDKYAGSFYFDVEHSDKVHRIRFANHHYYGEAIPCMFPYFGTAGIAEYTGCKPFRTPATTWFEPWMTDDEPDASLITYRCPEAFQKQKDAIARMIELSRGDYAVTVSDNCGIIDALAAIRGTENLLMDMTENPEFVEEALQKLLPIYKQTQEELFHLVKENNEGSILSWMHLWAPKRLAQMQCDMCVMISPQMFDRFVMPELEELCDFLDYPVYHFDGQEQIRHLDSLLSIKKLRAIQWTQVAGQPLTVDFIPVLQKIQKAGKNLVLNIRPQDVVKILDNLSCRGLMIDVRGVQSDEEAQEIMKLIQKHSKDRQL